MTSKAKINIVFLDIRWSQLGLPYLFLESQNETFTVFIYTKNPFILTYRKNEGINFI